MEKALPQGTPEVSSAVQCHQLLLLPFCVLGEGGRPPTCVSAMAVVQPWFSVTNSVTYLCPLFP